MSDELRSNARVILSLADEAAYLPFSRSLLARIGYSIVSLEDWLETPTLFEQTPALCIGDAESLERVSDEVGLRDLPAIMITRNGPVHSLGDRVVGAVPRPVGVHELYRLIQLALEEHPRGALRAPANLPALVRSSKREWKAALRSISESGCLVRTRDPLELGSLVDVIFELPDDTSIETRADVAYQLGSSDDTQAGLVFHSSCAHSRRAIASFVEHQLAPPSPGSASPGL